MAGRNEIAVEFAVNDPAKANGQNGSEQKRRKATAGKDQMVEMRFYIPGTTTRKEAEGGDAGSDADEEEKNAVMLFYDTLMEKADIGETAGDTIATFLDVLHLTPRFVPLADRSDTWLLMPSQRSLRHRHVRFLVPPARQDVRL